MRWILQWCDRRRAQREVVDAYLRTVQEQRARRIAREDEIDQLFGMWERPYFIDQNNPEMRNW